MAPRLAHTTLVRDGAAPTGTMLFLHGILGTRANWRSIARRVIDAHPEWAAMLVDLREHGDSLALPGPDTVAQCADDLASLADVAPAPITGVLGHSFGGKVALAFLDRATTPIREAFIVDSMPGHFPRRTATADTAFILDLLRAIPTKHPDGFETRDEFVRYVTDAGLSRAMAEWLAMNLRKTESGRRAFALDIDRIGTLLEDYARTDLWRVVESPPAGAHVHLLIGTRSVAYDAAAWARAEAAAAARPDAVFVHPIDAGHFVHVDAPDAVFETISRALR